MTSKLKPSGSATLPTADIAAQVRANQEEMAARAAPLGPAPALEDRVRGFGPHTLKKCAWMLKVFLDDPDIPQMRLAKSAATTAPKPEGEDDRVVIVKRLVGTDFVAEPASKADQERLDAWEAELAALARP